MLTKILKNPSMTHVVDLPDLAGTHIEPNDFIDLNNFDAHIVAASNDLVAAIATGTLLLNDGSKDLAPTIAINTIKGITQVFNTTPDGKQYVVSSTRPMDHFAYFSGFGDDTTNGIVGAGDQLCFDVPATSAQSKVIAFTEDVLFDGGVCSFIGASLGSWLSAEVIAPAGIPFPNWKKTGSLDLGPTGFVPNLTHTGAFDINPAAPTVVNRFINKVPLLGTTKINVDASEPSRIPHGYQVKLTVSNAGAAPLQACIMVNMYRKNTV